MKNFRSILFDLVLNGKVVYQGVIDLEKTTVRELEALVNYCNAEGFTFNVVEYF